MLCDWWVKHKWHPIPKEALPHIGIVVKKDDVSICAGFLYRTDSCIAWPEMFVSNPNYRDKKNRDAALTLLIDQLVSIAKDLGFLVCFASVTNQSLVKRLVNAGFKITDKAMTNLVRDFANGS